MKKVLVIALFVTVAIANHGWAQTPDARPIVQPGTIAILDTMAIVAKSPSVAPARDPLALFQAQPAPPAPARPATAPAAPTPPPGARPAPAPVAPPAAPAQVVPAPPAPSGPAPVRGLPGGPNIRFDVTITDTGGPKPVSKTLSLTIGSSNNNGSVRSTSQAPNPSGNPPAMLTIPLNVDVRNVNWLENGIRATVAIEYQPYLPDAKAQPGLIVANATTVFADGRKMQILATSDPVSDRKTTIEVTATVVK
jgi:hypothetical protein